MSPAASSAPAPPASPAPSSRRRRKRPLGARLAPYDDLRSIADLCDRFPNVALPHDALFKAFFGNPAESAAIAAKIFPQEASLFDWERMERCPSELVGGNLKALRADLIFSVPLKDGLRVQDGGAEVMFFFHFEAQSRYARNMPLRLAGYKVGILENWMDMHPPNTPLPHIISIVIYNGTATWPDPANIQHMYSPLPDALKKLSRFDMRFDYVLLDLCQMNPAELVGTAKGKMFLDLMATIGGNSKRANVTIETAIEAFFVRHRDLLEACRTETDERISEILMIYLTSTRSEIEPQTLEKIITRTLTPETTDKLMTTYQRWMHNVRTEGIGIGRAEGIGIGRTEGIDIGTTRGLLVGTISTLQSLFGLPVTPRDELLSKPREELETMRDQLEHQRRQLAHA
ncbi:MAG: Rpn family recombination-promoting nuclease/putative transposase [Puniceicoccales bacterium]|jgi:hypothetical protein|nr:Rpn family recombination-promoting nuclease/putative transposase [Puniceicoccales bacterium]